MSSRSPRPTHSSPLVTLSCSAIAWIHTILGFGAFFGALVLALSLHYERVVKNGVAGYPHEWWPSVSATIGDWPQERSLLQIFIAMMSGPRFALVLFSALLVSLSTPTSKRSILLLVTGMLRTFSCAGWVYCTSTDFPFVHDVSMITYLVLTPFWMFISWGSLAPQPNKRADDAHQQTDALAHKARRNRRNTAIAFFASIPFMCIFYYRHKVLEIPGAYTIYSFFEWNLIIQDLLFDCWSMYDLGRLEIHIVEAAAPSATPSVGGSWWMGGTTKAVKDGAWSTVPNHSWSELATGNSRSQDSKYDRAEVDSLLDLDFDNGKAKGITSPDKIGPWRVVLGLVSDAYLAFIWWTTLTALHPTIFFFSVYNLAIGGHEILLLTQLFALAVCLIPFIRNSLLTPPRSVRPTSVVWKGMMWALTMVSIGSWWIPGPLVRLGLCGLANASASVMHALDWGQAWQNGREKMAWKVFVWLIGLTLSSIAKYANHSNNPLWPFLNSSNGGQHLIGLGLAALCLLELLTRGEHVAQYRGRRSESKRGEASAALGMGALLFALHMFLTDSGTMIAWGWTGYPIKGPMAISHGWIIVSVALASTTLTAFKPSLGYNFLLLIILAISNALLLLLNDWGSFLGALGIAAILPLLALPITESAMRYHPLRVMMWSWFIADLLTFFQVLTVAYAFVPGGMPFRERTWLMLIVQLALLTVGLHNATNTLNHVHASQSISILSPAVKRATVLMLSALALLSFVIAQLRTVDPSSIKPFRAADGSHLFTAGIQTVHFGLDQLFYDSSRRMSSLYEDLSLDVFGLLESDLHRSVFGNRDLTQYLAESLKMYADIGPGPDKHTWGAALFSKFPIVNSTHHLLPSPDGELAPAIHAVLDVYGTLTHVWVSHNGQEETPLDRKLQTERIALMARDTYPHPLVVLSYLVTKPHAPAPSPYGILFQQGQVYDPEPDDKDRWCQYMGFRALEKIGYARVSRYTLSDTELQTIKLRVPRQGQATLNPDRDERTRLAFDWELDVPKEALYPTKFIDPPAKVYDKHKYTPYYYPRYYMPEKGPDEHVGEASQSEMIQEPAGKVPEKTEDLHAWLTDLIEKAQKAQDGHKENTEVVNGVAGSLA